MDSQTLLNLAEKAGFFVDGDEIKIAAGCWSNTRNKSIKDRLYKFNELYIAELNANKMDEFRGH